MKQSTNDQIEGGLHTVKGSVKETAGQVTNNPDLEAEGKAEKLGGQVQKTGEFRNTELCAVLRA